MIAEHALAYTKTAATPLPFLRSTTKAFLEGIVSGAHLLVYIRGFDGASGESHSWRGWARKMEEQGVKVTPVFTMDGEYTADNHPGLKSFLTQPEEMDGR